MFLASLHAVSGNCPDRLGEIDLAPTCAKHLTGAVGSQNRVFQGPSGHRLATTQLHHKFRKLFVGKRRVMAACQRVGLRKKALKVSSPIELGFHSS